jgi:hypothetical protein
MRYELTDHEWSAIKPMLPNKVRGVRRVDDRRVLNGIFLGLTVRSALARSTAGVRSIYHLLQSLHSLAAGGRLGRDYECTGSHA